MLTTDYAMNKEI